MSKAVINFEVEVLIKKKKRKKEKKKKKNLRSRRAKYVFFHSCIYTKREGLSTSTNFRQKWMLMMISGLVVVNVENGNLGLD